MAGLPASDEVARAGLSRQSTIGDPAHQSQTPAEARGKRVTVGKVERELRGPMVGRRQVYQMVFTGQA